MKKNKEWEGKGKVDRLEISQFKIPILSLKGTKEQMRKTIIKSNQIYNKILIEMLVYRVNFQVDMRECLYNKEIKDEAKLSNYPMRKTKI